MEITKRQLQENYSPNNFNNLPELSQIGTEEQYSAYLDTIFPSSKINQIMYHKTSAEKFDEFKVSRLGGVYFSFFDVPIRAGFIGKMIAKLTKERMVLAKVNVINPFIINRNNYKDIEKKTGGATQSVTELGKKYDLSGYDSILGYPNPTQDKGELDNFPQINFIEGRRKDLIELAVFNPKNIHILGSKQDIEGFKNFVNKNKQTQFEGMEISKKDLENQKVINQAHKDITRTKGKDYAPNKDEIQNWIDNNSQKVKEITKGKLKEDAEDVNFMGEITKGELEEAKKKKADRCTRIAKRKYDVWPSAYSSAAVVRCRRGKIWRKEK